MISSKRKPLTAWLGIIAMWLIVFAPLVSQLTQSAYADEPWAPICSASMPADAQHHAPVSSTLNACGYCDLLAHHTPMPTVPPATVAVALAAASASVPVLSTRFTALEGFPSGRPRGPPVVS